MDEARFWEIVDEAVAAAGGSLEEEGRLIVSTLVDEGADGCRGFQERLFEVIERGYVWNLVGAAEIVGIGSGGDAYMEFVCWLIAQGKDAFHEVLEDPNSLADYETRDPAEEWRYDELVYLPSQAHEVLTGDELDGYPDEPDEPEGDPLEDADDYRERFPELIARWGAPDVYGDDEDEDDEDDYESDYGGGGDDDGDDYEE
ncbi:MAG: DUF4240 domain-containing protein [Planctomycetota bacterium]